MEDLEGGQELTLEALECLTDGVEPYLFVSGSLDDLDGRAEVGALVVLKRREGLLLALPAGTLSEEVLEQGNSGGDSLAFDKSEGQEPNPLTSSITFDRWLLCFPRWICKARSSFAWNLRRSFTAEWCKVSAPSTTFPLPVPHPGCFDGGGPGLSRARLGRLAKKRFLHCTVMALNFLFLGRFPTRDEIGRRPNAWQCGVFDRLRSLLSVCGSSLVD